MKLTDVFTAEAIASNYTQAASGDFRFDNTGIDLVNSVSLEGQEVAF